MGMHKLSIKGQENFNKFGSKMIVIRDNGKDDIDVYFPEYNWTYHNTLRRYFRSGILTCPYEPRIYGIGYTGEGKYDISENGKITKCYQTWKGMLRRCYEKESLEKNPTYIGCSVCKEWHCFQNFAEWYYNNIYFIPNHRMHLDKDILIKGNKIYSPDTCVFVPERINFLFTKRKNDRGKYPIGVTYIKKDNKLEAQCNVVDKITNKGKVLHLGRFLPNQVDEAFQCYKTFKENYIKEVAEEYKELIPEKLYQALINYEVEIDD